MNAFRHWRATGAFRSGAALPLCLALVVSIVTLPLVSSDAEAQAFAAAPRLLVDEDIRPVALSNGFVNIRDRLRAIRVAQTDSGDGLAPIDVRRRWEEGLNRRIARVERRIEREGRERSRAWSAAVDRVRDAADPLREAQRLVHHSIRFRWDQPGRDHWQTPLETLARGAGDCEDHAILKRELLIAAGVDPESVSLLFLRTARGMGHVIVEVQTETGTRILDNRTSAQRIGRLLPGDQVLARHQTQESVVLAGL